MNNQDTTTIKGPEHVNRYIYVVFFIYLIIIAFVHNNSISIWDQDEGAYASIAKNMNETGNWVMPNAMWSKIHRKPPLHFWSLVLSFKVFGINEFAIRFPAALFTILNYLLILWAGRKLFGEKTSFVSVVILGTSLLVTLLAKVSVVDSTLLFFQTLCAFSILFVLHKRSKGWVLLFWLSFALALLTKGPPVVIFTFVFAGILALFHPQRRNLLQLQPWFFLPLAMAPFAYWCYLTTLQDGGAFLKWMLDWYILKRINGSVLGQTGPPGAHLLVIIFCFFPYLLLIPSSFYKTIRHFFQDKNYSLIFGAWFFSGWFIYELSPSKLPTYVITAHVPLAFIIAERLLSRKMPSRWSIAFHFIFQLVIASIFLGIPFYFTLSPVHNIVLYGIGSVLLVSTIASLCLWKSRFFFHGVIGYSIVFQIALCIVLLPEIDKFKDCNKRMSNHLLSYATGDYSLVIGNNKWSPPSLPFYLSNTFEEVKEENRFSELVHAYCSDTNKSVLMLSRKQFQLLTSVVGDISYKKFINQEVYKPLTNEYYVIITSPGCNGDSLTGIKVANPIKPLSAKEYEDEIRKSPGWVLEIKKKASLKGVSVDKMITLDALWIVKNETSIYNFDFRMRLEQKWLALMQKRAMEMHVGLEEACYKYASSIINAGVVN